MKTLLLTSDGMSVKKEFLKILPKPANKTRLAHIITASKVEKDKAYVAEELKSLLEAGLQVEDLDIEGKSAHELQELLEPKDVIYVQGGNTFYLMKHVRKSGFDKVIHNLVKKDVIYVGVSAGSIIAG